MESTETKLNKLAGAWAQASYERGWTTANPRSTKEERMEAASKEMLAMNAFMNATVSL